MLTCSLDSGRQYPGVAREDFLVSSAGGGVGGGIGFASLPACFWTVSEAANGMMFNGAEGFSAVAAS